MFQESSPYSTLWNKYRPVILKMMSDSEKEPQAYQLYAHEFKAVGQKERTGFSFTLQASEGRALNNIKTSLVATNLLQVLQQSKRASELMSSAVYELSLDKHFVLHVKKRKVEEPAEVS